MDLRLDIKPFELLLVSLDGEFVRRAMAQRFRKLPAFPTWLGELPGSANLQSLRSMSSWLVGDIERSGSPLAEAGKPRLHAERLLLSLFVECLAETAPDASEMVEDIGQTQVRMARDWIDANLPEAIGVEEVAAAIGVGVRSLQKSFQRICGCSPQEFITRRRLELARQMLLTRRRASNGHRHRDDDGFLRAWPLLPALPAALRRDAFGDARAKERLRPEVGRSRGSPGGRPTKDTLEPWDSVSMRSRPGSSAVAQDRFQRLLLVGRQRRRRGPPCAARRAG